MDLRRTALIGNQIGAHRQVMEWPSSIERKSDRQRDQTTHPETGPEVMAADSLDDHLDSNYPTQKQITLPYRINRNSHPQNYVDPFKAWASSIGKVFFRPQLQTIKC